MDTDKTNNNGAVSGGSAPQKYIRTFAGDVAVVQKGGMPDLAPLTPSTAPASPEPVAPVAPIAAPSPSWDEKVREETLARLRAKVAEKEALQPPPIRVEVAPPPVPTPPPSVVEQTAPEVVEVSPPPIPVPPPVIERPPQAVEEVAPLETPSPIHTYSGDFSDELKEKHASTATVLAAEQDAAPLVVEQEPRESGLRKAVFLSMGAVLIIGGGAGAYYAYTIYANANLPIIIAPVITAPIAVDEKEEVTGEGVTLMQVVSRSTGKALSVGSVRQLYSTNATTTRRSIFVMMRPQAPDILLRNVQGAKSMAGIINVGNGESPFFVLSVNSYNDSFAGMLSWESTMVNALTLIYPPYPTLSPAPVVPVETKVVVVATGKSTSKSKIANKSVSKVATSTASVVAPPVAIPAFHDEIIANHDVRVYRDAVGQSVLLYGYWNQTTLIIARDAAAFTEILRRLANTRK